MSLRISYNQIGLKFKLYSAEVLYNQGLAYLQLNQVDQGMRFLHQALEGRQIADHNVIDEAIANYGRGFTVFAVPSGIRRLVF